MEGGNMAAMARRDTAMETVFPCVGTESRVATAIARLYDVLDRVSEQDNPRTARLLASGRSKIARS
jgi:hypothetical protein